MTALKRSGWDTRAKRGMERGFYMLVFSWAVGVQGKDNDNEIMTPIDLGK